MRRIRWVFFLLMITAKPVGFLFAQNNKTPNQPFAISGLITDASKLKLRGVTVFNKTTKQSVLTNIDGGYLIKANNGDSIFVTMVGYEKKFFVANTMRKSLNITLSQRSDEIDNVVVTALGIKRNERELGYAFTEVNGDDLARANETNAINSLAGKVPGLVINSTAGGPAGSSRVIIRGATSLTGDNQPLYVIDGIPMDNSNYGQVGSDKYALGVDMGDAMSALNPDDIEKISVLKGPSASALYGSSAANGVILITTKKGNGSKELGVDFNSTATVETQLTHLTGNQYLYGQGTAEQLPQDATQSRNTLFTNFGPRLDPNLKYIGFDGVTRPYSLVKDNISKFFQPGSSFTNTLSLTGSTPTSTFRFSVADLRYNDIVPKSDIRRNTYTFSGRSKFGDKLSLEVRAVYLNEDVNNRPGLGDAPSNIGTNFNNLANNVDQALFATNYKTAQNEYVEWGGGQYRLDPYWIINSMFNKTHKDRITGSFNANYTANKWLSFQARASTDVTFLNYQNYSPRTTPGALTGNLATQNQQYVTNQFDVLATIQQKLTKTINFTARIGASLNQRNRNGITAQYSNMNITDVISPNSFSDKAIVANNIRREVRSAYGLFTFSYKNFLYVDATLREDASSTLPQGNNLYAYPSLSGSFIFTDAFKISKKILSFGKFRASYAEVGNDTDPYMLDIYYALYPLTFNGGSLGSISTTVLPNKNLKPTRTRSFELGTNLKFFNGRINFDGTVYESKSRDQINTVGAPVSSGFAKQIINAGVVSNKGIELLLSGTPVVTKNFTWDVSVNFARNMNTVESLADGVPFISLSDARWLGLSIVAMPGQKYGSILGYNYQRDASGNIILDAVTLAPKPTTDRQVLGKGTFDWTGGLTNRLTYKNFSLSAGFDVKYGADIFSMTSMFSVTRGNSDKTLEGREEWIQSEENRIGAKKTAAEWQALGNTRGYVPTGVVQTGTDAGGKPIYTKNTNAVDPSVYWSRFYSDGNGIAVPFIYKATYVKVRDITLSYRFPKTFNKKIGLKDLTFALVARNPFIIYKDIPNVDPDSNYNNGNGQGLEYGSLPSRKGLGFNLNVKF